MPVRCIAPPPLSLLSVACRDPEHGDRREALAFVAAGEDDRILARRELELRVADGNGVAPPRELGHFARREQAHLLGLQERNDFPVTEWRRYLHCAIISLSAGRRLR